MAEFIEKASGEQPVVQETAKQPYVKPETDVIEIDGERGILAMSTVYQLASRRVRYRLEMNQSL